MKKLKLRKIISFEVKTTDDIKFYVNLIKSKCFHGKMKEKNSKTDI